MTTTVKLFLSDQNLSYIHSRLGDAAVKYAKTWSRLQTVDPFVTNLEDLNNEFFFTFAHIKISTNPKFDKVGNSWDDACLDKLRGPFINDAPIRTRPKIPPNWNITPDRFPHRRHGLDVHETLFDEALNDSNVREIQHTPLQKFPMYTYGQLKSRNDPAQIAARITKEWI